MFSFWSLIQFLNYVFLSIKTSQHTSCKPSPLQSASTSNADPISRPYFLIALSPQSMRQVRFHSCVVPEAIDVSWLINWFNLCQWSQALGSVSSLFASVLWCSCNKIDSVVKVDVLMSPSVRMSLGVCMECLCIQVTSRWTASITGRS